MTIITEQQWYELESNNTSNNYNLNMQDRCKISNDDPDETNRSSNSTTTRHLRSRSSSSSWSEPRRLKTCNITQYMCSTTPPSSNSSNQTSTNETSSTTMMIGAMEILYEYELYYNPNLDMQKTIIPYLEESIIVHLSSSLGIAQKCRKQRRRRVESTALDDQVQFIGIQTKPFDQINPKYTTCQYPANRIGDASDAMVQCVPMLGGVTVFVQQSIATIIPPTSSIASSSSLSSSSMESSLASSLLDMEQTAIRSRVTSYLQQAMDQDIFVVPTSITKLVYVGNISTTSPNGTIGTSSSSASSGYSMKLGWIIMLIVLLLLLLIGCCCCFVCCCRRRRRKQQRGTATDRSSSYDLNYRSTVRNSVVTASNREGIVDSDKGQLPIGGKPCLASMDSLALKEDTDIETILYDDTVQDSEIPTDSDSSGFDDVPTTMVITGVAASTNLTTKKVEPVIVNRNILEVEDIKDISNENDDISEELVGQNVVDMIEERELEDEAQDIEDPVEGESLVETMSEEMDLLDRLALQGGRPPPYPSSSHQNTDLLMVAPTRSLSPTTISAASLGTSTYTGARNIVGSPTTCSQVTMPVSNIRYNSNRLPPTNKRGGFVKKIMMVPQHQQRFNSSNNNSGSIRTAYTPDSFDEEILGITSNDSGDQNRNCTTTSTSTVPLAKQMTVHDERQRYQQRSQHHTAATPTYPDVLDEHLSFNENDDELDDILSCNSDHNETTRINATGTPAAVQRHLQMS